MAAVCMDSPQYESSGVLAWVVGESKYAAQEPYLSKNMSL